MWMRTTVKLEFFKTKLSTEHLLKIVFFGFSLSDFPTFKIWVMITMAYLCVFEQVLHHNVLMRAASFRKLLITALAEDFQLCLPSLLVC